MAYRGVGGGVGSRRSPQLTFDHHRPTIVTGKRPIIYMEGGFDQVVQEEEEDDEEEYPLERPVKRRREPFSLDVHFSTQDAAAPSLRPETDDHDHDLPEFWPVPAAARYQLLHGGEQQHTGGSVAMERTASGHSISEEPTDHRSAKTELLEDAAAAQRVRAHMAAFQRRNPDSKHERVLRNMISPKKSGGAYPLDDSALQSIFLAANEMFFQGRLSQRVTWDWSHASSRHYDGSVIGTTALRQARDRGKRGFETLIVLSSPILRDRKYSRRLLISTFLHELIHSYLFICCGFRARHCGGHTPGFHAIARMLDGWAGPDSFLYLSKMEADLSCFRAEGAVGEGGEGYDGCRDETRVERERSPAHHCRREEDVYRCSRLVAHEPNHGRREDTYHHREHQHRGHHDRGRDHDQHDRVTPDRVAYFEEDYDSHYDSHHDDQPRLEERAAHPALPHHIIHRVPYFNDEDPHEFGSPYV